MPAPHTTYLQGSFRVTANATIRFTDDPTGTPTTSDWVVTAGTTYNSVDQLLSAWTTKLVSDLGARFSVTAIDYTATINTAGICQVDTAGSNYSITWSQAGDGTDLRDWLGSTGDITDNADGGFFQTPIPAAWYPQQAGRIVRRAASTRHRGVSLALDGTVASQGHTSPSDTDVVTMAITLWFGAANNYHSHQYLESFIDAVFDEDGGGEPWSIFDDGDQWVCRWTDSPLTVVPERVPGATDDGLWEVTFNAVAEVAAW